MEVNIVTIENGKEYIVIDIIVNNNGKYLILSNQNNANDMCIRKVIIEEGKEYISKLESEEEFNEVMEEFHFKHKRKENKNEE